MDRIWIETLKRLDALEKSVKRIEEYLALQNSVFEEKPESQKDTVDLPKIV